jgi:Aspartic acid proteinase inhibitor
VEAKEQVVAGILHHFTLEVIEAGNKKFYEAKVWVKPWLHFKQLQEFKHVTDSSFTSSDLGTRHGNIYLYPFLCSLYPGQTSRNRSLQIWANPFSESTWNLYTFSLVSSL